MQIMSFLIILIRFDTRIITNWKEFVGWTTQNTPSHCVWTTIIDDVMARAVHNKWFVKSGSFYSDSDSDKIYSTKIYTSTISGLHEFLRNTNNTIVLIYTWYKHRHVGRPPLRSYLTAGMKATRKGKATSSHKNVQQRNIKGTYAYVALPHPHGEIFD